MSRTDFLVELILEVASGVISTVTTIIMFPFVLLFLPRGMSPIIDEIRQNRFYRPLLHSFIACVVITAASASILWIMVWKHKEQGSSILMVTESVSPAWEKMIDEDAVKANR